MSLKHGLETGQYEHSPRGSIDGFLDSCHRYGWIITIVVNLMFFAYFVGTTSERLDDLRERVGRLEQQWDQYLHEVRGITVPPRK